MKRTFGAVLVLLFTLLIGTTASAEFSRYLDERPKEEKEFLFESSNPCIAYEKEGKISNLKSSNKKVATVKKGQLNGLDQNYIFIETTGKAGSTTISFKLKLGKKTKSYKFKYTFVKYTNPFKSLKIGSKNFANKYSKSFYYEHEKSIKGKLSFTLKSGWKLEGISCEKKGKYSTLKNGSNINYNRNTTIYIDLVHKSGISESFRFGYLK